MFKPWIHLVAILVAATLILTWQDNSDNEDGFDIWRSINESVFELVATTPANLLTWSEDIGQTKYEQRVCYELDAFNENGFSARAGPACIVIAACQQKGKSCK